MSSKRITSNLPLESVRESDIDLLMVEEFYANQDFVEYFLNKLGITQKDYQPKSAFRSLANHQGESDIVWLINITGRNLAILIEDKINAAPTNDQAFRYRKRGENLVKSGFCDDFTTVILSPERYTGESDLYHHQVRYEEIHFYFSSKHDPRSEFKAKIFLAGIEKQRRQGNKAISSHMTSFWSNYSNLVKTAYPGLNFEDKIGHEAGKGPASRSPMFYPFVENLQVTGSTNYFLHNFGKHDADAGDVSFRMAGASKDKDYWISILSPHLDSDMVIEPVGKSIMLRIPTPKLNIEKSFNKFCAPSVHVSLLSMQRLVGVANIYSQNLNGIST